MTNVKMVLRKRWPADKKAGKNGGGELKDGERNEAKEMKTPSMHCHHCRRPIQEGVGMAGLVIMVCGRIGCIQGYWNYLSKKHDWVWTWVEKNPTTQQLLQGLEEYLLSSNPTVTAREGETENEATERVALGVLGDISVFLELIVLSVKLKDNNFKPRLLNFSKVAERAQSQSVRNAWEKIERNLAA